MAILTIVDRGTQLVLASKVEHKSSTGVKSAILNLLRPFSACIKTLTNDNMNGLMRQYFPKKSDFRPLTNKDIFKEVDKLNNRPRKTLNYATPIEPFCDKYEKEAKLHL